MRKLVTALVLVLGLAGFGTASPVQAHPAAPHSPRTALPYQGHYRGMDEHHRTVTFSYSRSRGMYDFKVNHTSFGGAHVSGDRWHHTCHDGRCTRGMWHHDFYVTGHWNIPSSGADVFFEATAIAH